MKVFGNRDNTLPQRRATVPGPQTPSPYPPSLSGDPNLPYPAINAELAELRTQIPGVGGCVLGGVDGLLITCDLPNGTDASDLAALAATTFGLGRQVALTLQQGPFRQSTVRNADGYFSVYSVGDEALLSVVGSDAVNVARLHLYAPPVAERVAELLAARQVD